MTGSEPLEGIVHWGHFILRVQRPDSGRAGFIFVVEDVRGGEQARYSELGEALQFIQSHLMPEEEQS